MPYPNKMLSACARLMGALGENLVKVASYKGTVWLLHKIRAMSCKPRNHNSNN